MGTKVQCKSYLPGYYSMRDLNEDADSCWPRYFEDKALSGHLYNGFMLRPHGYSEYDKEMLKQTMLKHEAIFRKQVYELHRLYRTQKDLMDEFQKKGYFSCSFPVETSQSNSFLSQFPSEGTKMMWQMPLAVAGNNRAPVTGTDDKRRPLNFLNETSLQSGPNSVEKDDTLKDGEFLDSKLKRFPRRMLDLQLPADAYIDSEDAENESVAELPFVATVHLNRICRADPEKDVKLTLGTNEGPSCREDSWKSDSHTQNGLSTHRLADLNEPIREISFDGAAGSFSAHFLGSRTHLQEKQGHHLPVRSNTSFPGLQSAFYKDRLSDEGTSTNLLHSDKGEIDRQCPLFNNEAGQSRSSTSLFSAGSSKEKYPMSSEPIQQKLKKAQEILVPDQNKTEDWFKQIPTHGIEISRRSPHLTILNNSGPTAHPMPSSSFSVAPSSDCTSTAPLVSSWAKRVNSTRHDPFGVQGLPCFNGLNTVIQKPSNASDKRQYNGDWRSHLRLGSESSSYPNGFNHGGFQFDYSSGSQLNLPPINFGKANLNSRGDSNSEGCGPQKCFKGLLCTDVKSRKEVNLNETLLSGIQDGLTAQKYLGIKDAEGKCDDSSVGFSGLGTKTARNASQMELGFAQGYFQLKSSCSAVDPGFEKKQVGRNGLSLCSLQDFPSTLQVNESSKTIFGFPVLDKIQQSPMCSSSHQLQSVTGDAKCSDKHQTKVTSLEKQFSFGGLVTERCNESNGAGFRNHINLNSEFSAEAEVVEVPSQLSAPKVAFKVASEIDLEAPIDLQGQDNIIPSPGEPMPACKSDGSLDTECSHETLVREAAQNILYMSLDQCSQLDEITCWQPSSPVPLDTLHWFAEVVSSSAACVKESSDDGLDLFELMTLNLEETKGDVYWCRPWELEDQKDVDERGAAAASLLLTKPRRGQARKRRQRRDFQKDILPGLASLSRQEVTEDLQTIGGLMKASGRSWQVGVTRRNAGRNGLNSLARGRRRPRSLAISVEEIQVSPPPPSLPPEPTNNTEVEVNGRSMIGWGRTTRRCRRQRCQLVTAVSATLT